MTPSSARAFGRPPKFQTLCSQLLERAQELGPGTKMPTVVQLRDEMGVSMATLNSALKELETQNIIERKHGIGIYVSSRLHQKTVSLICDPMFFQAVGHSPFWDTLLESCRARAAAKGERFEMHFSQPQGHLDGPLQRGLAREIETGQVHGVIGIGLSIETARWIESQKIPLVAVFGPGQHRVGQDYRALFQMGVQALQQQRCRRIGFWAPVAAMRPFRLPKAGYDDGEKFRDSLREAGLDIHEELIRRNHHLVPYEGAQTFSSSYEQGFETAREVFSSPRERWPEGVVIFDDTMTQGALAAMQSLGIRPGVDVLVASHANKGMPIGKNPDLPLIRLEFDPEILVETAFSLLESLMSGERISACSFEVKPALRSVATL